MVSSDFDSVKQYFEVNNRFKDFPAHLSKVHSVDWNSDGRRLASGSFDKTVSLFSFSGEKLVKEHIFKGFYHFFLGCQVMANLLFFFHKATLIPLINCDSIQ